MVTRQHDYVVTTDIDKNLQVLKCTCVPVLIPQLPTVKFRDRVTVSALKISYLTVMCSVTSDRAHFLLM